MPRPRVHDEDLRTRLLERAGRIVSERGVADLSLRRLATDEATSTTAVYSLFGGKPGLLAALFQEAFESFGASQRAVLVTGDTPADLERLSWDYRSWAHRQPHLYRVMFGGALAGFDPDPEQAEMAGTTIQPLRQLVEHAVAIGLLAGDPFTITYSVWAAVHGLVSLDLAGCAPPEEFARPIYRAAILATIRGWTVHPD